MVTEVIVGEGVTEVMVTEVIFLHLIASPVPVSLLQTTLDGSLYCESQMAPDKSKSSIYKGIICS